MSKADAEMTRGKAWLESVLELMSIPASVSILENTLEIDADRLLPEQQEALIGQGGSTLDALQYLANTLLNLNQPPELQHPYSIDLAGYRQHRNLELERLVAVAVEHVRAGRGEYELQSLSSAERRQIHTLLATEDYVDLATFSRGREPNRCLVVCMADAMQE